jgi:hypothetical protein
MPLALSFPAIIIKRDSLLRQLELNTHQKDILDFSNHLLSSNLIDDYLLGIESMSNSFDIELKMLLEMGLLWNDGAKTIDFYITNQGSYSSDWLSYARIIDSNEKPKIYISAYKHTADNDNIIRTFDGILATKFPMNSITLDAKNWGKVAKEEGNTLHKPSIDEFMREITKNNRVCPNPILWNDLHTLAIESNFNNQTPPSLPLILGAWWDTSDADKAERLKELIDCCYATEVSDIAWTFVKSLDEEDWHHANKS